MSEATGKPIAVRIHPKQTAKLLTSLIIGLALANLVGQFVRHVLGHWSVFGLINLFDFDESNSLPNFFSTLLLLSCAVLLTFIALYRRQVGGGHAHHWAGLAVIFFLFSIDEAAELHEQLNRPVQMALSLPREYFYLWVLVALPLLAAFAFFYWSFWRQLPAATRWHFALAGGLYVGGALAGELLGALVSATSSSGLALALAEMLEELTEMIGLSVFVVALLAYMQHNMSGLRLAFGNDN